ncbi:Rha family transcriptional regulator, partial [Lacticaseibacillus paracasei]|uniref:Rha family transcriptional regulator n=1 Tax=Lacticaseibacillus paracasei TaxID=1597 RepID=UPI00194F9194
MNRDGFTLLAMGFTGKKALQFKIKYIQAFNSMETQIRTGYAIPGSYAEALKLAANQAEKIEDMKPKALFADAVATSHTSILIGDLAKLIRQNGVDIS